MTGRFPSLPWTDAAARWLEGAAPNTLLSLALVGLAIILGLIAIYGKPWLKALSLAWLLLP